MPSNKKPLPGQPDAMKLDLVNTAGAALMRASMKLSELIAEVAMEEAAADQAYYDNNSSQHNGHTSPGAYSPTGHVRESPGGPPHAADFRVTLSVGDGKHNPMLGFRAPIRNGSPYANPSGRPSSFGFQEQSAHSTAPAVSFAAARRGFSTDDANGPGPGSYWTGDHVAGQGLDRAALKHSQKKAQSAHAKQMAAARRRATSSLS